ncbi:hypothetical protein cyc_01822 [Cyclospora cayetanensis]|uniref:Uncharacterized protein n=1 Tax=Cyclospora cayetanensis TaxID=88456 RepID=A0A1D3CSM3_9EIME|nr:hypothetical protein cyc_01822 [Cyclospora cayetanensis]
MRGRFRNPKTLQESKRTAAQNLVLEAALYALLSGYSLFYAKLSRTFEGQGATPHAMDRMVWPRSVSPFLSRHVQQQTVRQSGMKNSRRGRSTGGLVLLAPSLYNLHTLQEKAIDQPGSQRLIAPRLELSCPLQEFFGPVGSWEGSGSSEP